MSQFGQPPLSAYLPLRAGQNLADLPDKAAALTNLGTLSTSDIMLNSVPIGTIIPFWGNTAPVGYLPCNGQTVNSGTFPDLVTFLGGGSSQALPDLRGEFLRGWDNGRGVDTGRAIKTAQADELRSHNHYQTPDNSKVISSSTSGTTAGSGQWVVVSGGGATGSSGGVETRPRNVSVLYCMKAYGALINTSTANIGNVLTELSQCVKTTQFGVALSSSGYQKLPSGLLLQWGTWAPNTTPGNPVSVSYALVFPNNVFSLTVSSNANNTSTTSSAWSSDPTLTGFMGRTNASSATQCTYIAIGY